MDAARAGGLLGPLQIVSAGASRSAGPTPGDPRVLAFAEAARDRRLLVDALWPGAPRSRRGSPALARVPAAGPARPAAPRLQTRPDATGWISARTTRRRQALRCGGGPRGPAGVGPCGRRTRSGGAGARDSPTSRRSRSPWRAASGCTGRSRRAGRARLRPAGTRMLGLRGPRWTRDPLRSRRAGLIRALAASGRRPRLRVGGEYRRRCRRTGLDPSPAREWSARWRAARRHRHGAARAAAPVGDAVAGAGRGGAALHGCSPRSAL